MSLVLRFLVWIGRLYTGFNLNMGEPELNKNKVGVLLQNDGSRSNGTYHRGNIRKRLNKKSQEDDNSHSKKCSMESNSKQIHLCFDVHPISIPFHWPVFTILISLSQLVCFQLGTLYANNGWVSERNFEANHLKRHEIWRIITSLFIHDGGFHLASLLDQMLTGCCLEIIHGWKPVFILYFGGALIADFGDLIGGTGILGCGASGAISALYAGNLATIILNWNETSGAVVRTILLFVVLFGIATGPYWYPFVVIILGPDLEYLFGAVLDSDVSQAAHIGGVGGGFIFGICLLKNFRERFWQVQMTKICRYIAILLVIIGVGSLFYNPLLYWNELQRMKINGKMFNKYEL